MDGRAQMQITDNLINLTSGLNTQKDKNAQGQFAMRSSLDRLVCDTMYSQNWLAGKVVDVPADSCSREWRQWNGSKAQIQAMEDIERDLKVPQAVTLAMKLSAKDGGAAILMGAGGDPASELNIATIPKGGLQFLHVVTRWELFVAQMNRDPMSPYFGQPVEYRMVVPGGADVGIHPSRVIPFIGVARADRGAWLDPWGDSVYERLHDPIRDAVAGLQIAASLLQEAKVDVIKIPGLSENVSRSDYRSAVMQRFGLAMALKSTQNTLILDAEEEWDQKTLTFQGIPEITERLLQVVAGAVNIPVTILLGRSPAGMNATGKADLEAFYTYIRSLQETVIRPTMERLDEALIRSATGRSKPRGLFYEWRSLWSPSAVDLADMHQKHAQAIEAYSRAGIFTTEALQAGALGQLAEDNFLSGIDLAVQANPGAPGNVQLQTQEIVAETRAAQAAAKPATPPKPPAKPTT